MKYWNNMTLLAVCLPLSITGAAWAEEPSYTGEQLHQELEWSGRNCVKPKAPPPESIRTLSYEEYVKSTSSTSAKNYKPKYVYWRRWIDIDGDGICEAFDVHTPEVSMTGRFYGYPVGWVKFKDARWTKHVSLEGRSVGGGGWFPLVLKDKKYQKVYRLYSPFYGLGGLKLNSMIGVDNYWGQVRYNDCDEFREHIALAYMLAFDPPPELKTDELMSDDWTGGDYIFAVFPGLRALTEKSETMVCIKPYLKIAADIDNRIRELYPTYFSRPYGLK